MCVLVNVTRDTPHLFSFITGDHGDHGAGGHSFLYDGGIATVTWIVIGTMMETETESGTAVYYYGLIAQIAQPVAQIAQTANGPSDHCRLPRRCHRCRRV